MLSLFLDVTHQSLRADFSAVDVALCVSRDAFGRACARGLSDRVGDECRHLAGPGAADADASLPAIVVLGDRLGFGIGHVEHVVLVDEDAAWTAELAPLGDKVSVLVENLDAIV